MTIYKEMKYQKRLPEAEKLAEGKVGVYKWKVLSHWTHPCGYVSVPENHPFYGKIVPKSREILKFMAV